MYTSTQQVDDHLEHEFGARYDDVRERYACQLQEARQEALNYQWEQEYMTQVWDAGFGTDDVAYEAYWKRLEEYSSRVYR